MSGLLNPTFIGRRGIVCICLERVIAPFFWVVCMFDSSRLKWGMRHSPFWEWNTDTPVVSLTWIYIRDIMVSN